MTLLANSERVQQPWRSFSPKVLLEFDKLFEVRLLIIPELNDQDLVLQQMAEWLSRLSTDIRIKLIVFAGTGYILNTPILQKQLRNVWKTSVLFFKVMGTRIFR